MDRAQIDAEHVIARYLSDQLSEADEAAFEAYCVQHPEIFREVESMLRMREGLAVLRDRDQLQSLIHHSRWRSPMVAAAAAALLCVVVGLWIWRPSAPQRPHVLGASPMAFANEAGRPLAISGSYLLLRSREPSPGVEVLLSPARSAIQIRILPSQYDPTARYRVTLERVTSGIGGDFVQESAGLRATADRYVTVYVDSGSLQAGDYRLSLTEQASEPRSEEPDIFPIRIRQTPTRPPQ
jgi:hypothetical protein